MVQATRKCSIDDCATLVGPHGAKGLCPKHYNRMRQENPIAPKCSISGCSKTAHARGWCGTHYARWRNHGNPEYTPPIRYCSIDGCGDKYYVRGWCITHYQRWRAHGDPNSAVFEKHDTPNKSFTARTQWEGQCLVWTGTRDEKGYGAIWVDGTMVRVHRYAWERANGPIPEGKVIDHICHNESCVNVKHLRIATIAQNAWNRAGHRVDSISGVRNVHKNGNGWVVNIRKGGNTHYFGYYTNIDAAARVAEQARKELFGEFAGKG